MSYVDHLIEARQKAWHEAKALLDAAAAEKRDLTAEEDQSFKRINDDLDRRAAQIEDIKNAMEREERINEAVRGIEGAIRPAQSYNSDEETLRALGRGEIRSAVFTPGVEARAISGASTGAPQPTSFYNQVIMQARLVGPCLDTSTVLNTTTGENLQIPRLSTYSTATVSTATAAIATSDPAFSAFITLGAFKYSFITQVALELLTDSGIDFTGFLAQETGNAVGYAVNTALTTGTGTTEPTGIVTAASVGGTTAATATITTDELISLYYTLDGAARLLPGVGWMMSGSTIAAVRKLKTSGSGEYIWTPSLAAGSPDTILGKPVYENPAMPSLGSSATAKAVLVGHLPSQFVRVAGGLQLDRSDDFAFNQGLATFRAQLRVDSNVPQTGHIKTLLTK